MRQPRNEQQLVNVSPPNLGGLLTKWHYHFQTQTAHKQTELFNALEVLYDAKQRALKASIALEISLVSLEFLEEFKEFERERIRAELVVRRNAIASELINSGVDLKILIRTAKEKIDPSPPLPKPEPKERPDPISVAIENAIAGGGKYTKDIKAAKERYIREKGRALSEEEEDRFRNAEQIATEAENSRR